MTAKSDWHVTYLIEAPALVLSQDPWCVGPYELSKRPEPFPGGDEAIRQSAQAHSIALTDNIMRLRTFITDVDAKEAIRITWIHAVEATVLFRRTSGMPLNVNLLRAGCLFDLRTGATHPIKKRAQNAAQTLFGTTAMMDHVATHPSMIINLLLSTKPDTFGELGPAVRRSIHWSHLAGQSEDYGQKFLMQWMAAETLTRTSVEETLTPKLMAAASLPGSQYVMQLPDVQRAELFATPEYQPWRDRLNALFDRMRDARNKIAHSGFREIDIEAVFSEADLLIVRTILPLVVGELQGMALNGLSLGARDIKALWRGYARFFLHHRPTTVAKHLKGNVLYRLNRPFEAIDE